QVREDLGCPGVGPRNGWRATPRTDTHLAAPRRRGTPDMAKEQQLVHRRGEGEVSYVPCQEHDVARIRCGRPDDAVGRRPVIVLAQRERYRHTRDGVGWRDVAPGS